MEKRYSRTKKRHNFVCLRSAVAFKLGCCALKKADLHAHSTTCCELVDRLFSACNQVYNQALQSYDI